MPTAYLKKLAKQGKGSIDSLEKKWDEAKKAAGKDADYGLVTHIFKNMVGIKSNYVTAEELFQMPNTMNSQTAALPGKSQSADHTLAAMATYYDPDFALRPAIKLSGAPLCHRTVADTIKERGDVSDKIWLFGLDQQFVMHSVLTNSNNRVVADAWKQKGGKFLGAKGYDDGQGRIIPYVGVMDVDTWFDEYFDFSGGIK